jgi:hypothetical protein
VSEANSEDNIREAPPGSPVAQNIAPGPQTMRPSRSASNE